LSSKYWPFFVAAVIFVLDRVTKLAIRNYVSAWDNHPVIRGFFSIVHSENPGAAFGMFADSTSFLRPLLLIALSLGVMGFIVVLLLRPSHGGIGTHWALRAGLALILGGAMGNLLDRVTRGTVTDFLELYFGNYTFPSFNVADSAITIGAGLLLIDMWRGQARQKEEHAPQTD
jgi:signal peptidase II